MSEREYYTISQTLYNHNSITSTLIQVVSEPLQHNFRLTIETKM